MSIILNLADLVNEKNQSSELWQAQRQVILDLAAQGPCVIVGRGADYILRDKADCLTVFTHADRAFRARRIVEVYGERDQAPEARIREKDNVPIILLTAKDSLQDKEEGYQVGADSYLTKPFSATLLHSRIHNLLESRKLLAERFNTNSILIDKRAAVTESMNKLDNEFLEKINKLIEDRLSSEKIDIGYLSDAMCMSNSTLYRKMKALTGLSTNEYIRKIKMQYAERLLLEGKYNISEVAFKVGINSTVYFRQCFKDEFGMAPSDYLKKIKPE